MSALLEAVRFLTCLPVPGKGGDPRALGRSAFWFPLVGLLVGGMMLGAYVLAAKVFPAPLSRILPLVLQILVSGAFHLDGLADTADAFYGGRDREDRLRILKDPHVGAMGAIAIAAALLLKAAALASLGEDAFRWALLAMPVLGHAAMTACLALPYAREEGLGKVFEAHRSPIDAPLAGLLALGAAFRLLGLPGLYAALGAGLALILLLGLSRSRIGGVTGDVCGAANEAVEAAFLVALCALV